MLSKNIKETVMTGFDIVGIPEETREEILISIGEILTQSILGSLYDRANEEEKKFMKEVLEKDEKDANIFDKFESLPFFKEVVKEEVEKLKKDSQDFLKSI